MADENLYTGAMQQATDYLIGIDHKLKSYGMYGRKPRTPADTRAESFAAMTAKYGKNAMQNLVARHGG